MKEKELKGKTKEWFLDGTEYLLVEDGYLEHPEVSWNKAQEPSYKDNWQEFEKILKENNVNYLYHFTDESNLKSIKENGGLYSWWMAEKLGISITKPGGNDTSKSLDRHHKLQNHVRLSFCHQHPMKFHPDVKARIPNPVILKISTEVVFFKETLFSDMNAAANVHSHGGDLTNLKRVKFDIIKKPYSEVKEDLVSKPYYQAEVLVKAFIPAKFILNLNEL